MIFGMTTSVFVHVVLSLIGVLSGFVAVFGLLSAKRLDGWTAIFLATTVLTSVTGFFLPAAHLMPSHIVGIISLVLLAFATFALYGRHLSGVWRPIYTVTATLALYLNAFVLIVQSFLKVPLLKAWAPTQAEPAFLLAQGAAFLLFLVLTILTTAKFRPARLVVR